MAVRPPVGPSLIFGTSAAIKNAGNLTLDMASVSGVDYHDSQRAFPMIINGGSLTLRNVSVANNAGDVEMILNGGSVEISHSSFVSNSSQRGLLSSDAGAAITVANSLFADAGSAACVAATAESPRGQVISLGGNVTTENSCGFSAPGDRVVAEAGVGSFGDNGGLVNTVLLAGNSPAVRNGVAANCEASDARGVVRNAQARGGCDSGAYEFGGGRGLLSQGGMSGFFYDAAADGHYVTVQRLDWGSALVVWNTFDKNGQAAWIYSIGSVDGNHVHAQGAQNLGGVLQPGGAPTGSHGVVWGDIDITFSNCFGGTFSYNSPLASFGSGQFPLNRLAFLGDLDCSN
ncbi:MAG TPA: choice-of-anchor Q domain-containing protein [Rudaea sp.]|nr:choice-of-anchor Q domain-containing protein [Rudaea sp.]